MKERGLPLIALTTSRESTLGRMADVAIENGGAPGDAMARIPVLDNRRRVRRP